MAKAVKKPKKKTKNGYRMPEPLPEGEILIDIAKNKWRLGTSIGKGGFGEIYSAQEASKTSSKYPFVAKVEPHENGPLFVEMHFYMKNAKQSDIDAFRKKHKLKTLGMPAYIGSGSHELDGIKYRFIVMEKFGTDIDKLLKNSNGVLSTATVFQLAWQITYVLEYIHESGYVHGDIKGGNVLLGASSDTKNQIYLLDFGLATKSSTDTEFKPNPKKAHDGTIEYLSRDAHQGVPTKRGDFEILAYNIIHWLGGRLPWQSKLDDPKAVQQEKENSMNNIPVFLKSCFSKAPVDGLVQFLKYINKLKFNEQPNYNKIRDLFKAEIEKAGCTLNSLLEFQNTARKRRSLVNRETPEKKSKEEVAKKEKVPRKKVNKQKEENDSSDDETESLTDAMKEILAKRGKNATKKKKPVNSINGDGVSQDEDQDFEGYTAEMIQIKMKKINKDKGGGSKKKTAAESGQSGDGQGKAGTRILRSRMK